jgi:DNA-binding protein HU-beta
LEHNAQLDWEVNGKTHLKKRRKKQGVLDMAKAMTKSQIVAAVAEAAEISKKQSGVALDALSALAYKNAKNGFTVPGLGKLVLVSRKARMGRNPATGETIKIAAKKVVKFRVAKAAKDAILGAKK